MGGAARTSAEIQRYLELLQVTPASLYRARLHDRLAESYVHLRKLGAADASARAIEHYDAIIHESPWYPNLDAVLYYDAIEHEVIGDQAAARRAYNALLSQLPSSVYAALAHCALADLLIGEAAGDRTKYQLAIDEYAEALTYAESPIAPDAAARLIELYIVTGDMVRAEQTRQRLLHEFGSSSAAERFK